ncbi:MAG TPA: hypothetical protein VMS64_17125 [Candidatus Methylomirabilis sp.]|nr:hypothetical protein [Candidatus Methylomirabilis sp.]
MFIVREWPESMALPVKSGKVLLLLERLLRTVGIVVVHLAARQNLRHGSPPWNAFEENFCGAVNGPSGNWNFVIVILAR